MFGYRCVSVFTDISAVFFKSDYKGTFCFTNILFFTSFAGEDVYDIISHARGVGRDSESPPCYWASNPPFSLVDIGAPCASTLGTGLGCVSG